MVKDQKPYKLLVVDDNLADFILIEDFLEEQMLHPVVIRAKNFKEAEEILKAENQLQAVLLDLSLPDKSGEELISGIMEFSRDLPVIVLTGYSDINFGIKSLLLGASDYLLKDELNTTTLYKTIVYNIERKKIINNLQESEQRSSKLFQLSPQPNFVCDSTTFQFLDVNQAAITHYGYSLEEFLDMKFTDLYEDSIPDFKTEDLKQIGALHHKKNGELIKVEIHFNNLDFKGKEAKIILINDVTERLHYIQAIEKQNEKLKFISWKQSHLVRAPLARIMGMVSLISEDLVNEQEKKELLNQILSSAEEFDEVIKEIVKQTEKVESFMDYEITTRP